MNGPMNAKFITFGVSAPKNYRPKRITFAKIQVYTRLMYRTQVFRFVKLSRRLIEFQNFEVPYPRHLQGSVCPRRIIEYLSCRKCRLTNTRSMFLTEITVLRLQLEFYFCNMNLRFINNIRLTTSWTVRGSKPGEGEIFRTRPDRSSGQPPNNG